MNHIKSNSLLSFNDAANRMILKSTVKRTEDSKNQNIHHIFFRGTHDDSEGDPPGVWGTCGRLMKISEVTYGVSGFS